jgi:hypothetical protein
MELEAADSAVSKLAILQVSGMMALDAGMI